MDGRLACLVPLTRLRAVEKKKKFNRDAAVPRDVCYQALLDFVGKKRCKVHEIKGKTFSIAIICNFEKIWNGCSRMEKQSAELGSTVSGLTRLV